MAKRRQESRRAPDGATSKTEIGLKVAVVVLGLLMVSLAFYFTWSEITTRRDENDIAKELDDFALAFSMYDKINAYSDPVVNHFDVFKLNSLSAEDIKNDLSPKFDFIIEIIDVSQYTTKYSFDLGNSTAFKTGGSGDVEKEYVTCATLMIGQERHAALLKISMRV